MADQLYPAETHYIVCRAPRDAEGGQWTACQGHAASVMKVGEGVSTCVMEM
jgi:hypothetical protein